MHTPAGLDRRTQVERDARELVLETCQRRGEDAGYFLSACSACGDVVMGSRHPLCYRCLISTTIDEPTRSVAA
ncbi:MAG TPA: hypothetical protein VFH78_08650 [Candidatus Thermoplasmatota archaeon]|nr:hypothetical protein [Candidatus Thermoplasmatota archaeon]